MVNLLFYSLAPDFQRGEGSATKELAAGLSAAGEGELNSFCLWCGYSFYCFLVSHEYRVLKLLLSPHPNALLGWPLFPDQVGEKLLRNERATLCSSNHTQGQETLGYDFGWSKFIKPNEHNLKYFPGGAAPQCGVDCSPHMRQDLSMSSSTFAPYMLRWKEQ
jgi:hypothetical protein